MVGLEVQKPTGIAGGFVLVDVPWLMAAWTACRSAPLGLADFRSLLAAREMVARRCLASEGRAVTYDVPELARLLGVTEKRAKASLRRLQAAGLIVWNESAISFPEIGDRGRDQVLDTIGQGRGSLAIPRRILRVLSGGARPTLIATTLGILLRGLSRRKGGFDGRGRVKAGWIAQTFGVDQRRVKQARKDLVALGWIKLEPDGQRAMNRWGRAFRIDLAWDRVGSSGPSLPPPPAADRPEIATPSVHQEPLPEREENQEPASGGPAGVEVSGPETDSRAGGTRSTSVGRMRIAGPDFAPSQFAPGPPARQRPGRGSPRGRPDAPASRPGRCSQAGRSERGGPAPVRGVGGACAGGGDGEPRRFVRVSGASRFLALRDLGRRGRCSAEAPRAPAWSTVGGGSAEVGASEGLFRVDGGGDVPEAEGGIGVVGGRPAGP
jgi:Mn-dependent DtxR family transcriptional regulator